MCLLTDETSFASAIHMVKNSDPSLIEYLQSLHDLVVQEGSPLALVVLDCKPDVATPGHGAELLHAIRKYLTYDNDLNVIISVGKLAHTAIFDQIANAFGPSEGAMIDAEDNPVAVAEYFSSRGITHQCYGNGISVLNSVTGPHYRYTIEHACEMKASQYQPRWHCQLNRS